MHKVTNINQRIRKLVDHLAEGNAARFARSIGVVQQRFDRLLKPDHDTGKYAFVKADITDGILTAYPKVNKVWLLSGEGVMFKDDLEDQASEYKFGKQPAGVPFYKTDFSETSSFLPEDIEYHIDFKIYNTADFWCRIAGHSMEPEINHGDIVAMKRITNKKYGILFGEVYGIITKDFCALRRIIPGKSERYIKLVPANKCAEYPEQEILISKIDHIFLVLCCVKKI